MTNPAEIQRLAERGEAPNQCPECQSFRIDGEPPYLHRPGCSRAEPIEDSIDRFIRETRSSAEPGASP